jgi:TolA-binding protein
MQLPTTRVSMSTSRQTDKTVTDPSSTDLDLDSDASTTELVQFCTELSQRVSELESTVQEQAETIDQLRDDLRAEKEMRGKQVAETRQQVEEVRETVSVEETPTPEAGQTTVQPSELTPVEQIARADDVEAVTDSASVRRAVTLFKNLEDWGEKAPKGITLKPSDNPLSLLEAACGESLCWKQWYRTAETLESLSEGAATFFDSDRHGKMICLHEQSEVYDRVTSGELSPSSARAEA